MVFDVRCVSNPYWVPELRKKNGLDSDVQHYLSKQNDVVRMYSDIRDYLNSWLPAFKKNNRVYMTVAIGCTGGQHRSVYIAEKLKSCFAQNELDVLVRHRELNRS